MQFVGERGRDADALLSIGLLPQKAFFLFLLSTKLNLELPSLLSEERFPRSSQLGRILSLLLSTRDPYHSNQSLLAARKERCG
jgi:hypothetical protein